MKRLRRYLALALIVSSAMLAFAQNQRMSREARRFAAKMEAIIQGQESLFPEDSAFLADLAELDSILIKSEPQFTAAELARKHVIDSFYNAVDSFARQYVYERDTVRPSWMDTVVYAMDSLGVEIKNDQGESVVDTFATITLRNRLDPEYNAFWLADTITLPLMDSLYAGHMDSLMKFLPDSRDIKAELRRQKKEVRDSIVKNTPRILESFAIPDSLYYKQILSWTHDPYTNRLEFHKIDTSYNTYFFDSPIYSDDVDATYLGVSGSAAQQNNFFRRKHLKDAPFFDPYMQYGFTAETLPLYNTKSPYTILAYWGNPFIVKAKEESDLHLMSSQNITPALNFTLDYRLYGGAGMLLNESTSNKNSSIGLNYMGKRYEANFGYISQSVRREENGGVQDVFWATDTIVDAKTITVNLDSARNKYKRRTLFLTQSYAIPMNFFRKDADSLSVGEGTMAQIGHSIDWSTYAKTYTDNISSRDSKGSAFYRDAFNICDGMSRDSLGVSSLDNKLFVNLQPYASDAILSGITAGAGYQILTQYGFDPAQYITGKGSKTTHNTYLYGAANGMFRKYFKWDAFGKYYMSGYYQNDMELCANARFSVYPIEEGIHLIAHAETRLEEPAFYQQRLRFNHRKWDNDFSKISTSRLEASLEIPKYDLKLSAGYALIDNMIYYDSLACAAQNTSAVHVLSLYLDKNFRIGPLHLDNRLLYQKSSDEESLPLPELSANLRYYLQFPVVKNVMEMQIGANAVFYTPYHIQGFVPDLGVFYNQNEERWGGNPYIDAFVNVQWKRACVFVKYTNVGRGWPANDYFSASRYIRPTETIKLGVFWPFYAK